MEERGNKNRFPLGSIFGVALALLATGGGLTWFAIEQMKSSQVSPKPTVSPSPENVNPPVSSTPKEINKPIPAKPEPKAETETVQVYWIDGTQGEVKFNPMPISVQKTENKSKTIKQAFRLLLAGPVDNTHTTTIPQETKLLKLKQDKKGIHIDLSQAFTQGGGSDVMIGRLAQVLYTATSLDPNAKVWINVEGEPLEVLGEGDGLMIDQPMTRQSFKENFDFNAEPQ
ncbi:hypothetical protein C7H19_12440 [Aphanothece hegewaldii CCALA 016]|uniref:GerMN domain-containing protein n=1 Tax=Aphanothece hegewaldii CCALA 016 TaxID=2107694 RepID=A0A2T1LX54_9CHRO|nr:GerMN domain-containing protein [Aphanothece hegewaldii]PSF36772.1 hypothetical protein C7H19_12440 [Aphanothece hegewaldii CCALA 016]